MTMRNRHLETCPVCNTDQYLYAKKFTKHEFLYFGRTIKCSGSGMFPHQAKAYMEHIKQNSIPEQP